MLFPLLYLLPSVGRSHLQLFSLAVQTKNQQNDLWYIYSSCACINNLQQYIIITINRFLVWPK